MGTTAVPRSGCRELERWDGETEAQASEVPHMEQQFQEALPQDKEPLRVALGRWAAGDGDGAG